MHLVVVSFPRRLCEAQMETTRLKPSNNTSHTIVHVANLGCASHQITSSWNYSSAQRPTGRQINCLSHQTWHFLHLVFLAAFKITSALIKRGLFFFIKLVLHKYKYRVSTTNRLSRRIYSLDVLVWNNSFCFAWMWFALGWLGLFGLIWSGLDWITMAWIRAEDSLAGFGSGHKAYYALVYKSV